MANLADKSGDAYSNIVQGKGTPTLAFPMPATVPLDVESVVATINNAAGGDTTPTLVVRDSSGEVIATKRMDDTIPAGGSGTATFSLRNADSVGGSIRYDRINSGDWLRIGTTGSSPTAYQVGNVTSTWSVGINGDVVAVGADTDLFLTAQSAVEIRATGAVDVFTDGPVIVAADRSTQTYGGAVSFNVGDGFAVEATNDVSIAAAGQEIDLTSSGILVSAHDSEVAFEFGNYNAVRNGGTGFYHVQCDSYLLNSNDLDLVAAGGEFQITTSGTFLTGDTTVSLAAGKTLTVTDRVGNPIFRVNEDGSLQGKTGKALTFNL